MDIHHFGGPVGGGGRFEQGATRWPTSAIHGPPPAAAGKLGLTEKLDRKTGGRTYPKDDEQRRVSIDKTTCKLLREHMLEYSVRDVDLLFTSKVGTALSRNNLRTKYWGRAVKAAEVEQKVTFHNLRAAHASWLLAGGADIISVQERLGHRRITTTQQYTGTLPDAGERALEAFRKIRYRSSGAD